MTNLKDCPFCGGKAGIKPDWAARRYWFAYCEGCLITSPMFKTKPEAERYWNTRADDGDALPLFDDVAEVSRRDPYFRK